MSRPISPRRLGVTLSRAKPGRAALVIAVLILPMLICSCIGQQGLAAGTEAPNFGIKVSGKTVSIQDLRGHVVVVNFWSAT